MKCSTCEFENPADTKFCSNCGAAIADPLAIGNVRARVQRQLDGFVAEQLREQKLVEREALDRIQDGAIKRYKVFAFLLATVIGGGGIVGLKEIWDTKEVLEATLKNTEKIRDETKGVYEQAQLESTAIITIKGQVEQIQLEVDAAKTEAFDFKNESKDLIKELNAVDKRLDDVLVKAQEKLDELEDRTTFAINAKYKISVHVPPGDIAAEPFLLKLRETLDEKGFKVRAEDTLWLTVNETEILYYYDGDKDQAEEIQRLLRAQGLLRATLRKNDIPSRNFEIQIKVSAIPVIERD